MATRIADRFGPVPPELLSLFDIVRVRHLGEKLGFEKIIIKNGIVIAFFVANPMSAYYRGNTFNQVMEKIVDAGNLFELKQNDGRLRVISRGVNSIADALRVLRKLQ
jgi:transcription-repair coupling factor (superfamily II helicase)